MNNNTQFAGKSSALIIGSGGQDGTYLAELLVSQGTRVFRVGRDFFPETEDHDDFRNIDLSRSDLSSNVVETPYFRGLSNLIKLERPSVIYHLAAHHSPSGILLDSESDFRKMWMTSVGITATVLETIFTNEIDARVVVAGTSQMYTPIDVDLYVNEETPTNPQNYYAKTKADSREVLNMYRALQPNIGQMAILFNHESPRRGPGFLSTDIAFQVMQVIEGTSRDVSLRNPFARLDLTDARDVVEALARMPRASATDYVIGRYNAVSIFDLVQKVLLAFGLEGVRINALKKEEGDKFPPTLIADTSRARANLSWNPTREVTDTIVEMVKLKLNQL